MKKWLVNFVRKIVLDDDEIRQQNDRRIEQHIKSFESDMLPVVNKLVDSIYTDEKFLLLDETVSRCVGLQDQMAAYLDTTAECAIATKQALAELEVKIDRQLEGKASASIVEQFGESIVKILRAMRALKDQVESAGKLPVTVPDDVNAAIKKTRADAAAVMTKIKDEVSRLDVKLDAFIDTMGEKIAELKNRNRK